ncbi:HupE/UreJ family protein [Qipengyuania sp. MTN3-11]|uniref:HupE/UreJ family protein n=1 Tax=Qipengyuania sp. MTN3-11 TaxID=3056557 RepID=UPI0036F40F91
MIARLIALVLLLCATPAAADELRPASISFEQVGEDDWQLGWKQPIASRDAALAYPVLPDGCTWAEPVRGRAAVAAMVAVAAVRCAGSPAGKRIGAPDLVVTGDALVRIAPLGRPVQAYRLTASEPFATIAAKPDAWQVWRSYFAIGVEHILMGWDHLLFVIALVLLVTRGWAVVGAATAFTVAHSLTLAAVTLGFAGLPQRPVEALIALSIVFLAVELARGGRETLTRRLPWLVAFSFGLLHGFGFAGALREIGLPEGEVPAALVSFNLGVEAGQLVVIAAVLAIRWLLSRSAPQVEPRAIRVAAYGIGITGSYWLVERVLSPWIVG